ncbi:hypothetical protein KKE75_03550 [Patescibacteria group bacterium]|nr:hypothetical protein [Patescibacteria group bacterium]
MYSVEGTRIYTAQDQQPGKRIEGLLKDIPENYQYTGFDLNVRFNQKTFPLPIVTVNPQEPINKRLSIAWFNPLRPDLAKAAAADMANIGWEMVKNDLYRPVLIVVPPTEKSLELSLQTMRNLSDKGAKEISAFKFSGGIFQPAEDKRQVTVQLDKDQPAIPVTPDRQTGIFRVTEGQRQEIIGICYQPVTGKNKFLYLTEKQIADFNEFIKNNGRVIFNEDVVNTGATIKAMRQLFVNFCGAEAADIQTVAAAFEGNRPCSDPTVHYAIWLPEWIGKF